MTRKATPDLMGGIDIMDDILSAGTAKPVEVSWHGKELDYPIGRIKVGKRLRPLGDVNTLAESMRQIGLLNPVNILPDGTLIAGNHRVAAAKALGWDNIRVRVVELSEIDAELAEIDENLRRNNLTVLEESEHLMRRMELLEAKGIRAKAGDNQHGGGEMVAPPTTTADIATEIGISERSTQMRLQIARNLDGEVRDQLRATEVANSTTQLVELSRQPAEKQRTIADMLISGQAANVNEAVRLISPPPAPAKKEYWTPMPVSEELPAWAAGELPQPPSLDGWEFVKEEQGSGWKGINHNLRKETTGYNTRREAVSAVLQGAISSSYYEIGEELKAKREAALPPLTVPDLGQVSAFIYRMAEKEGYNLWPTDDEEWLIAQIISKAKTRDWDVSEGLAVDALQDARNDLVAEKQREHRLERARAVAEQVDAERKAAEATLAQDAAVNVVEDILNPVPVSLKPDYDSDEWYTPSDYIEAARRVMGSIDLDPASCDLAQTVVQADVYLTKVENGLKMQWIRDNVWLNCPYSDPAPWIEKVIAHNRPGRQAVILVNNATETEWFQSLLKFYPVCFPERRIAFWRHDQKGVTARQGQAIFYLGPNVADFVREFRAFGPIMQRKD